MGTSQNGLTLLVEWVNTNTQTQTSPYRVVSVEEGATTFIVWHTGSLTHDKTRRALAPFDAVVGVAFGGRRQVGTGGRAWCHTRRVRAVGTAGEGWEKRGCASIGKINSMKFTFAWEMKKNAAFPWILPQPSCCLQGPREIPSFWQAVAYAS